MKPQQKYQIKAGTSRQKIERLTKEFQAQLHLLKNKQASLITQHRRTLEQHKLTELRKQIQGNGQK